MKKVPVDTLSNVPETLLLTVYLRALETMSPDAIIRDDKAVEIVERIDYDFSGFDSDLRLRSGMAVRTEILDAATRTFIEQHPDAAVVNLGAGLDTRVTRVDNGRIHWFDLDVPEAIEIRRRFFEETDRLTFIARSVMDFEWMDLVPADRPLLFILEGLLMYFQEREVRSLVTTMADRFGGAEILAEAFSRFVLRMKHEAVDQKVAPFTWGITSFKKIEAWHPAIRLVDEWYTGDYHSESWGLLYNLLRRIPRLRRAIKFGHLRIEPG